MGKRSFVLLWLGIKLVFGSLMPPLSLVICLSMIPVALTGITGGLGRLDSLLTASLEGSNACPTLDIVVEGISLITPLVEVGWTTSQACAGWMGSDGRASESARALTASLAMTWAISLGLKYSIRRERPTRSYQPRLWNTRITPSFPSGHAATSAAFATLVSRRHPNLILPMLGYVFLSAYSQVYVGNHYLGDVVSGALLGMVVGKLVLIQSKSNDTSQGRIGELAYPVFRIRISLGSR
ncbi:MAG: phosphatase PAP2 family protein [Fidelibacterota bacterium]|nr:MAG: phosphatase PAP2 family protein [Candidatus Neomarinimicrobiota bacterium]